VRYQAALRPDKRARAFKIIAEGHRKAVRGGERAALRRRGVPRGNSEKTKLTGRRIIASGMGPLRYALVAYVKAPMAEFVERLRSELHPGLPHLPAHITILPPRLLRGSEAEARSFVEEICKRASPFAVELGEVGTFVPVTPTVFLRVARGAYRIRELHDCMNANGLQWEEEWLFMPHLTLAKMDSDADATAAMQVATRLWSEYRGSRRVLVNELTFVREATANTWDDLAPMPLGGELVSQ
jgi:2'-5' RNA ligase